MAFADPQQDLAYQIEQAGTHAEKDERHVVEIDACTLTTMRWRDRSGHGWILWTSFEFQMGDAKLNTDNRPPHLKYAYAVLDDGPPEEGFALVGFKMREGTFARQERSILRKKSANTAPSPRGDGTSHYYQQLGEFFFTMRGQGVEAKVKSFTGGYDRYVGEYCAFTS